MLIAAAIWITVAFVAFVFLLMIVRMFFRGTRGNAATSSANNFDWQLADLRKMVDSGQMSEEEYRRARDVVLSRTSAKFEPVKGFPVLGPVDQTKSKEKQA